MIKKRKSSEPREPLVELVLAFPELLQIEGILLLIPPSHSQEISELRSKLDLLYPQKTDQEWFETVSLGESKYIIRRGLEWLVIGLINLHYEQFGQELTMGELEKLFQKSGRSIERLFFFGLFKGEFSIALTLAQRERPYNPKNLDA